MKLWIILCFALAIVHLGMARPQFVERGSFSDRYYSQQDRDGVNRVLQNRERYTVPTGQGVKVDMFNE